MTSPFDTIRAYLNDPDGFIFTDEALAPFAAEAVAMTPRIAAGLVALSRGAYQAADRLLRIERVHDKVAEPKEPEQPNL